MKKFIIGAALIIAALSGQSVHAETFNAGKHLPKIVTSSDFEHVVLLFNKGGVHYTVLGCDKDVTYDGVPYNICTYKEDGVPFNSPKVTGLNIQKFTDGSHRYRIQLLAGTNSNVIAEEIYE